jgi:hypothetical protein
MNNIMEIKNLIEYEEMRFNNHFPAPVIAIKPFFQDNGLWQKKRAQ